MGVFNVAVLSGFFPHSQGKFVSVTLELWVSAGVCCRQRSKQALASTGESPAQKC